MTINAASSSRLPRERTGASWSFPYAQPYSIQLDLMQALYDAIDTRRIGVFESPTGTGKSLSLICATFTWLQAYMDRVEKGQEDAGEERAGDDHDDDDDEPQWVKDQAAERRRRERMRHEEELKERIQKVKEREMQLRAQARKHEQQQMGAFGARKKMNRVDASTRRRLQDSNEGEDGDDDDDDDAFLPSSLDANSGEKPPWQSTSSTTPSNDDSNLTPEVRTLMAKLADRASGNRNELDELPETTPKIIYACRTHSQLSQFVAELKKTAFGRDLDVDVEDTTAAVDSSTVRVIPLGSRKQMCINESVQKLGSRAGNEAMNEACRELISSSGSTKKRCEHLPTTNASGQAQVLEFRDRAMAQVRDIEDLVQLGRDMNTCPYYASRTSAKQAQLITLPYNLLLQRTARQSLGISLKGSVIIIDEAHNLIDTILNVYTVSITSAQITTAKTQINEYLRRFSTRLRGESEMHLRTLRRLLEALERAVKAWSDTSSSGNTHQSEEVWTAERMLSAMGGNADTIHFAHLERFLKESQIARKVSGYAEKSAKAAREAGVDTASKKHTTSASADSTLPPSAISAMHSIESFVLSLSNSSQDGRVLLTRRSDGGVQLKYQLLNPSESFTDLASEARSIILAGGTMDPLEDLQSQLMPSVPLSRLTHFSCGHIVPSSNLLCSVVASGPRGSAFEFKYDKRGDVGVLDDLGNALVNFSALVPHGLVVFLPSYKFLDDVVARWKTTQASANTWTRLTARKKIFLEPKEASEVDAVLQAYSSAIHQQQQTTSSSSSSSSSSGGAILLAVVGAKLSEGINFSDRLARAVVMVGMPFPNAKSAEIVERMNYVRRRGVKGRQQENGAGQSHPASHSHSADAGQNLYTSMCMKSVNQSIGRAIRHQNDFAALLLVDVRYARRDIVARLPAWIRDHVKVPPYTHSQSQQTQGFGNVMKDLGAFFRDKRARGLL